MLLVLVGGVMSANAWDTVYLNDNDNSWGNNGSQPFTKVDNDGNHHTYTFGAGKVNQLRNGNYQFRFYVSNGGGHFCPQNDNDVISSTDYANCKSGDTGSFRINKNENAKSVEIDLNYNNSDGDWKWHLKATVTAYDGTTDIYYVNENGKTSLGNNVYAYVWDPNNSNLAITGTGWPGSPMTSNSDGTFTLEGVNFESGMKVIFNNNDGTQTDNSGFGLAENSFYNFSGQVTTVTVSITNDYGTFASPYPLTFPENGEIYAYKASQIVDNKMIMERVTGTVPAKTGLFLEKKTANSMTVSPCATTTVDASGNYLKAGGVSVISDGTGDRYGFQTQSSGVGFYKITENAVAVPANKAYLELPVNTVTAPSLSIEIDGETTGIKVINWEDVDANSDGQIYDLQGRRVYQPTTGIYIKNGKKVIVK